MLLYVNLHFIYLLTYLPMTDTVFSANHFCCSKKSKES